MNDDELLLAAAKKHGDPRGLRQMLPNPFFCLSTFGHSVPRAIGEAGEDKPLECAVSHSRSRPRSSRHAICGLQTA